MRVRVESQADVRVSQAFLDDLGVDFLEQHQGSSDMAQIVEAENVCRQKLRVPGSMQTHGSTNKM